MSGDQGYFSYYKNAVFNAASAVSEAASSAAAYGQQKYDESKDYANNYARETVQSGFEQSLTLAKNHFGTDVNGQIAIHMLGETIINMLNDPNLLEKSSTAQSGVKFGALMVVLSLLAGSNLKTTLPATMLLALLATPSMLDREKSIKFVEDNMLLKNRKLKSKNFADGLSFIKERFNISYSKLLGLKKNKVTADSVNVSENGVLAINDPEAIKEVEGLLNKAVQNGFEQALLTIKPYMVEGYGHFLGKHIISMLNDAQVQKNSEQSQQLAKVGIFGLTVSTLLGGVGLAMILPSTVCASLASTPSLLDKERTEQFINKNLCISDYAANDVKTEASIVGAAEAVRRMLGSLPAATAKLVKGDIAGAQKEVSDSFKIGFFVGAHTTAVKKHKQSREAEANKVNHVKEIESNKNKVKSPTIHNMNQNSKKHKKPSKKRGA